MRFYNVKVNNNMEIKQRVISKIGLNLHKNKKNPIGIVKKLIEKHFNDSFVDDKNRPLFKVFDSLNPIVSTKINFDQLLIPKHHVSRSSTDTFYIDEKKVLRTHMTCHTPTIIKKGVNSAILFGDCYRNDSIDSSHYPIFHQVDAFKLFNKEIENEDKNNAVVIKDMKNTIEKLIINLYGKNVIMRWNKDYFPFTDPSYELEVKFQGKWLELLGCGIIQNQILKNAHLDKKCGWAFGIGLERLAMSLFSIPNIRLFHSTDQRFTKQFQNEKISKFKPFSKFPSCFKDISFWLKKQNKYNEKHIITIIKQCSGDLLESIKLIDEYEDNMAKKSKCFRMTYRSFRRNLVNNEVDKVQNKVRKELAKLDYISLR